MKMLKVLPPDKVLFFMKGDDVIGGGIIQRSEQPFSL